MNSFELLVSNKLCTKFCFDNWIDNGKAHKFLTDLAGRESFLPWRLLELFKYRYVSALALHVKQFEEFVHRVCRVEVSFLFNG